MMTIPSVINENAEKRLHPTPNDRYSAHQHNRCDSNPIAEGDERFSSTQVYPACSATTSLAITLRPRRRSMRDRLLNVRRE
jgi:hypothetical protein